MVVPSCNATAVERIALRRYTSADLRRLGWQTGTQDQRQPKSVEQITRHQSATEGHRRGRGAPRGNANARKHGFWGADALEVRGWMRLQLRVGQLMSAHIRLAGAVI